MGRWAEKSLESHQDRLSYKVALLILAWVGSSVTSPLALAITGAPLQAACASRAVRR